MKIQEIKQIFIQNRLLTSIASCRRKEGEGVKGAMFAPLPYRLGSVFLSNHVFDDRREHQIHHVDHFVTRDH